MKHLAIAHEGTEDKKFVELIMTDLRLDSGKVEFYRFGSKSNFFKTDYSEYQQLKARVNADQVEKILLIIDADDVKNDKLYGGYKNTETAIKNIIQEQGFSALADFYISCDPNTHTGYIESLILFSISESQRNCIEAFLKCSEFKSKQNHKAILNQIYRAAYPNSPYDLKNPCFDILKQKIGWLFS